MLTPLQLKQTNIIFVEHSQMKDKIFVLNKTIVLQDSSINILKNNLNNKSKIIKNINNIKLEQFKSINYLTKSLNNQKKKTKFYKKLAIGSCSVSIGLFAIITLLK